MSRTSKSALISLSHRSNRLSVASYIQKIQLWILPSTIWCSLCGLSNSSSTTDVLSLVESSYTPLTTNLTAQIATLNAQVQENSNHFMTLEDENADLRLKNRDLQEQVHRFMAIKYTLEQPCISRSCLTAIPMQHLVTPELKNSSS